MEQHAPRKPLYRAASALLNGVLALDPAARKRLEALEGRCLQLHCTVPEVRLVLRVHEGRIVLSGAPPEEAAGAEDNADPTCVRGPLSEFLALRLAEDKGAQLVNGALSISGDSRLFLQLQELLEDQQPDWEGGLARLSGDIPAHLLGNAARRLLSWRRLVHESAWRNLRRYLTEERALLPSSREFQQLRRELRRARVAASSSPPL